jgi:ATP-dependent RNA helicase DDX55/SPB4
MPPPQHVAPPPPQVGAIIVSPTRELSRQIFQVADPFIQSVPGLTSCLLVGGSDPALDAAR